jgi:hypothetical protein
MVKLSKATNGYTAFRLSPSSEKLAVVVSTQTLKSLVRSGSGTVIQPLEAAVVPMAALEDYAREELEAFEATHLEEMPPSTVQAEVRFVHDPDGPMIWVVLQRASGLPVLLEAVLDPEMVS